MTRDEALAKLRPMEANLRAQGIDALYLFGSVARDEASPTSDVDLMYDFSARATRDYYQIFHTERVLEACLGMTVDLVDRTRLHPRVARYAEVDSVRVF